MMRGMTAVYSETPLARKLGIREGHSVGVVGDPGHFAALVEPLPPGAELVDDPQAPCPVLVMFVHSEEGLRERLPGMLGLMPADGSLWAAWPKKSSPLFAGLTEDVIRGTILPLGLVDNKVCAMDRDWSGLRLVVRRTGRPTWNRHL